MNLTDRNNLISYQFPPRFLFYSALKDQQVLPQVLHFLCSSGFLHYTEPVIILGLNIQSKLWFPWALTLASLWAARTLVSQVNLLLKVYLGRGDEVVSLQHSFIAHLSSKGGKDSPSLAKIAFFQGCALRTSMFLIWKGFCLCQLRNLGWMTQSSSPRPTVTHKDTAALFPSLSSKQFHVVLAVLNPFWMKNPHICSSRIAGECRD